MPKKQSHIFLSSGAAKYIETGLIVLIVILFAALAFLHADGTAFTKPVPTPAPTDTPHYLSEAELNDFLQSVGVSGDTGSIREPAIETDSLGVLSFSFFTPLREVQSGDSAFYRALREKVLELKQSLIDFLSALLPFYGGDAAQADQILERCLTVLREQRRSSLSLPDALVTIEPAQGGVRITFSRSSD